MYIYSVIWQQLYIFHIFQNLLHCAWSPDGQMVSAGSADRFVYIWDSNTRKIMYKLPGHLGSVNDVDFHKVEPIGELKFISFFILEFGICFKIQN